MSFKIVAQKKKNRKRRVKLPANKPRWEAGPQHPFESPHEAVKSPCVSSINSLTPKATAQGLLPAGEPNRWTLVNTQKLFLQGTGFRRYVTRLPYPTKNFGGALRPTFQPRLFLLLPDGLGGLRSIIIEWVTNVKLTLRPQEPCCHPKLQSPQQDAGLSSGSTKKNSYSYLAFRKKKTNCTGFGTGIDTKEVVSTFPRPSARENSAVHRYWGRDNPK